MGSMQIYHVNDMLGLHKWFYQEAIQQYTGPDNHFCSSWMVQFFHLGDAKPKIKNSGKQQKLCIAKFYRFLLDAVQLMLVMGHIRTEFVFLTNFFLLEVPNFHYFWFLHKKYENFGKTSTLLPLFLCHRCLKQKFLWLHHTLHILILIYLYEMPGADQ